MRIVVTGGAGYIGSITTRELLDSGHEVVVVDTLERGHAEAVDSRARLVVGDVGDVRAISGALVGAEAVLHLAGYIDVAESVEHSDRYLHNNFAAPCVMLDAMYGAGVDALVFSSTAAVYGEPVRIPIQEIDPTSPINPYGASKLQFERELEAAGVSRGLRSIVFRYFNVAGATPDGLLGEAHAPETHIIPRILDSIARGAHEFTIYGDDYPTDDGTCVRDYIHVCDLARAHRIALERLGAYGDGGTYNLAGGAGYSNREIVATCAEVTGADVEVVIGPRRSGDPAMLIADASHAAKELGWSPLRSDLRTMIEDAWRWRQAKRY